MRNIVRTGLLRTISAGGRGKKTANAKRNINMLSGTVIRASKDITIVLALSMVMDWEQSEKALELRPPTVAMGRM